MTTHLSSGGNRVLVGEKEIEDYSNAVFHAFNDGWSDVTVEGLGERCGKAIRVAKDVVALQSDISILRIDSITRLNPNFGRVKGVQVILIKKGSTPEAPHEPKASGELLRTPEGGNQGA